jgi:hypothetical protein
MIGTIRFFDTIAAISTSSHDASTRPAFLPARLGRLGNPQAQKKMLPPNSDSIHDFQRFRLPFPVTQRAGFLATAVVATTAQQASANWLRTQNANALWLAAVVNGWLAASADRSVATTV